jgi:hypothetical protein
MKDFLFSIFAALYAGFLFAVVIGSAVGMTRFILHFLE